MRMNTSLPAQIQTPNLAETVMRGRQMQMMQQEFQNRNALAGYLKDNGAGIMSGDPNALAGLAQYDPNMALGIQNQGRQDARAERAYDLDVRRTDASIADSDARLGIARQQAAQSAAEHAQRMSALERQTAAAEAQRVGAMATAARASGAEAWDAFRGSPEGEDFAPFDFGNSAIAIAGVTGTVEGLGLGDGEQFTLGEGQTRYDAQGNVIAAGPEKGPSGAFQTLQERAFAAGLGENTPEYQSFMLEGGPGDGSGMTIYDPATGRPLVQTGTKAEQKVNSEVSGADNLLQNIDDLYNDPQLRNATGWGAAVPIDIPGFNASTRSRIEQVQGAMFLKAFESLKGGGAITEVEGTKATQAMGRLKTAQTYDEFRSSLAELYDITNLGRDRMLGLAPMPTEAPRSRGALVNRSGPGPAAEPAASAPAPSGVDPQMWDVLTPEERALWQN